MLDRINWEIILAKIIKKFSKAGIYPKIGIELEFYLENKTKLSFIQEEIEKINIPILLKNEIGLNQHEICIDPSTDIINYIILIDKIRDILEKNDAEFEVFYKEDTPPNSIHLNINFVNNNFENLFRRKGNKYNKFVEYSIAGLCFLMSESLIFFLPKENDYKRFNYAPKNISWGANNRTTSLRLPENTPENFRIEHRIISPKANLFQVTSIILLSVHYGIQNKLVPPIKIYDLADKRIDLDLLPNSFEKSYMIYEQKQILKNLIKDLI